MQFCIIFLCVFLLFYGRACYFLPARVTKSSSTDFKSPSTSVHACRHVILGPVYQKIVHENQLECRKDGRAKSNAQCRKI